MSEMNSFEEAFRSPISSCRGLCDCGKQYFDSFNEWDWEDGELETLDKDDEWIPLDYSVGMIRFEGRDYVYGCSCWIERANKIISFLNYHDFQIADYLNAERKRKINEANMVSPVNQTNGGDSDADK